LAKEIRVGFRVFKTEIHGGIIFAITAFGSMKFEDVFSLLIMKEKCTHNINYYCCIFVHNYVVMWRQIPQNEIFCGVI